MMHRDVNSMDGERVFAGLDIGGTKTAMMVCQGSRIKMERVFPSLSDLSRLGESMEACLQECGLSFRDVDAMAVGVPGRVDPHTGLVMDAPGLGWQNLSLQQKLFRFLPFPCVVENDITMALIAEITGGKAQGQEDVVFLAIGTGVGSAILANGQMIGGSDSSAGEIGYCIFEGDLKTPVENPDGQFGMLENKMSGRALAENTAAFGISPQVLFAEYDHSDAARRKVVDHFLRRLSIAIANMVNILNPNMVILGGGVSESLEGFLNGIRQQVSQLTPIPVRIEISSFYNRAGMIGACRRAQMLFEKEQSRSRMTAAV